MPAFMYGSHYSNPGTVIFYLLRLPPYCCAALDLQGGKFDFADRLFHSVAEAYHNCTHSDSDMKELVPEFFSTSAFLRNDAAQVYKSIADPHVVPPRSSYRLNFSIHHAGVDFKCPYSNRPLKALGPSSQLPLGCRQDGTRLHDVVLPAWANGDADEFVRLNRAALESEHVSRRLHLWIDLVFGFEPSPSKRVERRRGETPSVESAAAGRWSRGNERCVGDTATVLLHSCVRPATLPPLVRSERVRRWEELL
jgi:hypothetical protein